MVVPDEKERKMLLGVNQKQFQNPCVIGSSSRGNASEQWRKHQFHQRQDEGKAATLAQQMQSSLTRCSQQELPLCTYKPLIVWSSAIIQLLERTDAWWMGFLCTKSSSHTTTKIVSQRLPNMMESLQKIKM